MNMPQVFNEESGEIIETEAGDDDELDELDKIADATAARIARARPMSWDEIQDMRKDKPTEIGVMGWFAKVGETTAAKGGKIIPGSHIVGQILEAVTVKGKFRSQQCVIVYGQYSCPKHKNASGEVVDAVNGKLGRWLVGVDSTLAALPGHIGSVVEIRFKRKGGNGKRHEYDVVSCWDT